MTELLQYVAAQHGMQHLLKSSLTPLPTGSSSREKSVTDLPFVCLFVWLDFFWRGHPFLSFVLRGDSTKSMGNKSNAFLELPISCQVTDAVKRVTLVELTVPFEESYEEATWGRASRRLSGQNVNIIAVKARQWGFPPPSYRTWEGSFLLWRLGMQRKEPLVGSGMKWRIPVGGLEERGCDLTTINLPAGKSCCQKSTFLLLGRSQ